MSQEIFQKVVNDAEKQQCHVTHCSIVLKVRGRGGKDSRILVISDVFISYYRVKRSPSRDRTMYWPFLTKFSVKENVIELEFGEENFRFETQETNLITRKILSIIQRVLSKEAFSNLNIPSSMIEKELSANGRGILSRFVGFCYKSGVQKMQSSFSILKKYLSQHSTTFDFSSIDVGSAIVPLMRTLCQIPFCESISFSRLDKNEAASTFSTLIKYGSQNLQHIQIKGQSPNEFWATITKISQAPKIHLTGISFSDCNFTEKDLFSIQQLIISKKMNSISLQNSLPFTKISMPYSTFFMPSFCDNLLMLNLDRTSRLNVDQLFQCIPNIHSLSLSGCELDIIPVLNSITQRKLDKLILLNLSNNFCKSYFTDIKFPKLLLRLDVNGIKFDSNKLHLFFENLMNNEWNEGLILSMSSIEASDSDWNKLFECMDNLKRFPLLRLTWTDNQIDHNSFYSFLSSCTKLQYLNISRCLTSNLPSVFFKINNSMSNMPLLNTIILTGHKECPLQDQLNPFLKNLINIKTLRILDISNNKIDINTFHCVAELLSKNISIHTINLDGSQIDCLDPYKEIIDICIQKYTPVYISWPSNDISRLFTENKITVTDISNFTESLQKARKVFYDRDSIPNTKMPLEEPFEVFEIDNLNQFPNYVSDEVSEIFFKTENQANEYEIPPTSPMMLSMFAQLNADIDSIMPSTNNSVSDFNEISLASSKNYSKTSPRITVQNSLDDKIQTPGDAATAASKSSLAFPPAQRSSTTSNDDDDNDSISAFPSINKESTPVFAQNSRPRLSIPKFNVQNPNEKRKFSYDKNSKLNGSQHTTFNVPLLLAKRRNTEKKRTESPHAIIRHQNTAGKGRISHSSLNIKAPIISEQSSNANSNDESSTNGLVSSEFTENTSSSIPKETRKAKQVANPIRHLPSQDELEKLEADIEKDELVFGKEFAQLKNSQQSNKNEALSNFKDNESDKSDLLADDSTKTKPKTYLQLNPANKTPPANLRKNNKKQNFKEAFASYGDENSDLDNFEWENGSESKPLTQAPVLQLQPNPKPFTTSNATNNAETNEGNKNNDGNAAKKQNFKEAFASYGDESSDFDNFEWKGENNSKLSPVLQLQPNPKPSTTNNVTNNVEAKDDHKNSNNAAKKQNFKEAFASYGDESSDFDNFEWKGENDSKLSPVLQLQPKPSTTSNVTNNVETNEDHKNNDSNPAKKQNFKEAFASYADESSDFDNFEWKGENDSKLSNQAPVLQLQPNHKSLSINNISSIAGKGKHKNNNETKKQSFNEAFASYADESSDLDNFEWENEPDSKLLNQSPVLQLQPNHGSLSTSSIAGKEEKENPKKANSDPKDNNATKKQSFKEVFESYADESSDLDNFEWENDTANSKLSNQSPVIQLQPNNSKGIPAKQPKESSPLNQFAEDNSDDDLFSTSNSSKPLSLKPQIQIQSPPKDAKKNDNNGDNDPLSQFREKDESDDQDEDSFGFNSKPTGSQPLIQLNSNSTKQKEKEKAKLNNKVVSDDDLKQNKIDALSQFKDEKSEDEDGFDSNPISRNDQTTKPLLQLPTPSEKPKKVITFSSGDEFSPFYNKKQNETSKINNKEDEYSDSDSFEELKRPDSPVQLELEEKVDMFNTPTIEKNNRQKTIVANTVSPANFRKFDSFDLGEDNIQSDNNGEIVTAKFKLSDVGSSSNHSNLFGAKLNPIGSDHSSSSFDLNDKETLKQIEKQETNSSIENEKDQKHNSSIENKDEDQDTKMSSSSAFNNKGSTFGDDSESEKRKDKKDNNKKNSQKELRKSKKENENKKENTRIKNKKENDNKKDESSYSSKSQKKQKKSSNLNEKMNSSLAQNENSDFNSSKSSISLSRSGLNESKTDQSQAESETSSIINPSLSRSSDFGFSSECSVSNMRRSPISIPVSESLENEEQLDSSKASILNENSQNKTVINAGNKRANAKINDDEGWSNSNDSESGSSILNSRKGSLKKSREKTDSSDKWSSNNNSESDSNTVRKSSLRNSQMKSDSDAKWSSNNNSESDSSTLRKSSLRSSPIKSDSDAKWSSNNNSESDSSTLRKSSLRISQVKNDLSVIRKSSLRKLKMKEDPVVDWSNSNNSESDSSTLRKSSLRKSQKKESEDAKWSSNNSESDSNTVRKSSLRVSQRKEKEKTENKADNNDSWSNSNDSESMNKRTKVRINKKVNKESNPNPKKSSKLNKKGDFPSSESGSWGSDSDFEFQPMPNKKENNKAAIKVPMSDGWHSSSSSSSTTRVRYKRSSLTPNPRKTTLSAELKKNNSSEGFASNESDSDKSEKKNQRKSKKTAKNKAKSKDKSDSYESNEEKERKISFKIQKKYTSDDLEEPNKRNNPSKSKKKAKSDDSEDETKRNNPSKSKKKVKSDDSEDEKNLSKNKKSLNKSKKEVDKYESDKIVESQKSSKNKKNEDKRKSSYAVKRKAKSDVINEEKIKNSYKKKMLEISSEYDESSSSKSKPKSKPIKTKTNDNKKKVSKQDIQSSENEDSSPLSKSKRNKNSDEVSDQISTENKNKSNEVKTKYSKSYKDQQSKSKKKASKKNQDESDTSSTESDDISSKAKNAKTEKNKNKNEIDKNSKLKDKNKKESKSNIKNQDEEIANKKNEKKIKTDIKAQNDDVAEINQKKNEKKSKVNKKESDIEKKNKDIKDSKVSKESKDNKENKTIEKISNKKESKNNDVINKDINESKDNKEGKEIKNNNNIKESKVSMENKEIKDDKEIIGIKDDKEIIDNKDIKDDKNDKEIIENKDIKDIKDDKDIKNEKEIIDNKDIKGDKEIIENKDIKEIKANKAAKDNKERKNDKSNEDGKPIFNINDGDDKNNEEGKDDKVNKIDNESQINKVGKDNKINEISKVNKDEKEQKETKDESKKLKKEDKEEENKENEADKIEKVTKDNNKSENADLNKEEPNEKVDSTQSNKQPPEENDIQIIEEEEEEKEEKHEESNQSQIQGQIQNGMQTSTRDPIEPPSNENSSLSSSQMPKEIADNNEKEKEKENSSLNKQNDTKIRSSSYLASEQSSFEAEKALATAERLTNLSSINGKGINSIDFDSDSKSTDALRTFVGTDESNQTQLYKFDSLKKKFEWDSDSSFDLSFDYPSDDKSENTLKNSLMKARLKPLDSQLKAILNDQEKSDKPATIKPNENQNEKPLGDSKENQISTPVESPKKEVLNPSQSDAAPVQDKIESANGEHEESGDLKKDQKIESSDSVMKSDANTIEQNETQSEVAVEKEKNPEEEGSSQAVPKEPLSNSNKTDVNQEAKAEEISSLPLSSSSSSVASLDSDAFDATFQEVADTIDNSLINAISSLSKNYKDVIENEDEDSEPYIRKSKMKRSRKKEPSASAAAATTAEAAANKPGQITASVLDQKSKNEKSVKKEAKDEKSPEKKDDANVGGESKTRRRRRHRREGGESSFTDDQNEENQQKSRIPKKNRSKEEDDELHRRYSRREKAKNEAATATSAATSPRRRKHRSPTPDLHSIKSTQSSAKNRPKSTESNSGKRISRSSSIQDVKTVKQGASQHSQQQSQSRHHGSIPVSSRRSANISTAISNSISFGTGNNVKSSTIGGFRKKPPIPANATNRLNETFSSIASRNSQKVRTDSILNGSKEEGELSADSRVKKVRRSPRNRSSDLQQRKSARRSGSLDYLSLLSKADSGEFVDRSSSNKNSKLLEGRGAKKEQKKSSSSKIADSGSFEKPKLILQDKPLSVKENEDALQRRLSADQNVDQETKKVESAKPMHVTFEIDFQTLLLSREKSKPKNPIQRPPWNEFPLRNLSKPKDSIRVNQLNNEFSLDKLMADLDAK